jgi:hypothetical protein
LQNLHEKHSGRAPHEVNLLADDRESLGGFSRERVTLKDPAVNTLALLPTGDLRIATNKRI